MGENTGRRKESNECQMELTMSFDLHSRDETKHDHVDEGNIFGKTDIDKILKIVMNSKKCGQIRTRTGDPPQSAPC